MARQTIKSLMATIDIADSKIQQLAKELDDKSDIIRDKRSIITKKDAEILLLQKHIGFVHAQRDRLVGFVKGRESLTDPIVDIPDTTYHRPQPISVNRVEKFINECTLQFVNPNGPIVRDDSFRSMY